MVRAFITRNFGLILLVLSGILYGTGAYVGLWNLGPTLLQALSGGFFSLSLFLLVLRKYDWIRQQRQWGGVKGEILRGIQINICNLVGGVHYLVSNNETYRDQQISWALVREILFTQEAPSEDGLKRFEKLIEELEAVQRDQTIPLQDAREFYGFIETELKELQEIWIPRAIEAFSDTETIQALVQFELAVRRFGVYCNSAVYLQPDVRNREVIEIYERARDVYERCLWGWETENLGENFKGKLEDHSSGSSYEEWEESQLEDNPE